jgi:[ribosomal protein S18]-alanine N-acetyltransferase
MSAQLHCKTPLWDSVRFEVMAGEDIDAVVAIEQTLYSAPWSAGNFRDSLAAGYSAWVLRDVRLAEAHPLLGYFLLMCAIDEAHLLNVSVALPYQRSGFGLSLINKAVEVARSCRARVMILEVRPSNHRAIDIYERYGFEQIGLRPGYYPLSSQNASVREDAKVMRYVL